MSQAYTKVTSKGQITLSAEIRRVLGIKIGDRIAISIVEDPEEDEPQLILRPVRSVAEMTFGAVSARVNSPDSKDLRSAFEEETAQQVVREMSVEEG